MYLKKIEIIGFKSFAEETILEFQPGITAIVGPNGCGKSNLLDAIRWVLGEQNPRLLRGNKMMDVIWNGSATRPASSFAEVSLTFADPQNVISVPYQELVITRRLFRSGESEYLINRVSCRLKDIEELFMDTGIGATSYWLVEQGKIDQLLNMKEEDIRLLFSEVAGITKYIAKKKEAISKLDKTQTNLVRIQDIKTEVFRQRNALKRQAAIARRYSRQLEELKILEISKAVKEYQSLFDTEQKYKEEGTKLSEKRSSLLERMRNLEEELTARKDKLNELEKKITFYEQEQYVSFTELERCKNKIEIATHELATHSSLLASIENEINQIENAFSLLEDKEKKAEESLNEVNHQIEIKREEQKSLELAVAQLNAQLNHIRKAEAIRVKNLNEYKMELTKIHTELNSLESELKKLLSDRENLIARINEKQNEKNRLEEKLIQAREEKDSIKEIIEKNKSLITTLTEQKKQKQIKKAEIELLLKQTKEKAIVAEGQLQSIKRIIDSYAYYGTGVKAILKLKNEKPNDSLVAGIIGPVAELITEITPGYELAIDSALGQAKEYIVVENISSAISAIKYLRENELGDATFLFLTAIQPKTDDLESSYQPGSDKENSVYTPAIQLVRCSDEFQLILNKLLKDTFVVNDLETAISLLQEKPEFKNSIVKFVTLNGDVIVKDPSTEGILIYGGQRSDKSSLFMYKRELDELTKEIASLHLQINELSTNLGSLDIELAQTETQIVNLTEELESVQFKLAELTQNINAFEAQISHIKEEADILNHLYEKNIDEENAIKEKQAEMLNLQTEVTDKIKEVQETLAKLEIENRLAAETLESENAKLTNLNLSLARLEERKQHLEKELAGFRNELLAIENARANKIAQKQTLIEKIRSTERNLEDAKSNLEKFQIKQQENASHLSELLSSKESLHVEIKKIENAYASVLSDFNIVENKLTELQLAIERVSWQINSIKQKIMESYQLDLSSLPDELSASLKTDLAIDELTQRINQLKSKLKVTEVVPEAHLTVLKQYEELSQRLDFLTRQEKDLKDACNSLQNTIQHIDETATRLYKETISKIQENFHTVFRTLFKGGIARISLSNTESPLEAEIEIMVQPPGKRLKNISLLSGGEKALAGIALLFSLYLIKPSPICILDEIDASLDDVNTKRFCDLLISFKDKSQFIIITHNKITMGLADILYGITMEEPGVSKLLGVQMANA